MNVCARTYFDMPITFKSCRATFALNNFPLVAQFKNYFKCASYANHLVYTIRRT